MMFFVFFAILGYAAAGGESECETKHGQCLRITTENLRKCEKRGPFTCNPDGSIMGTFCCLKQKESPEDLECVRKGGVCLATSLEGYDQCLVEGDYSCSHHGSVGSFCCMKRKEPRGDSECEKLGGYCLATIPQNYEKCEIERSYACGPEGNLGTFCCIKLKEQPLPSPCEVTGGECMVRAEVNLERYCEIQGPLPCRTENDFCCLKRKIPDPGPDPECVKKGGFCLSVTPWGYGQCAVEGNYACGPDQFMGAFCCMKLKGDTECASRGGKCLPVDFQNLRKCEKRGPFTCDKDSSIMGKFCCLKEKDERQKCTDVCVEPKYCRHLDQVNPNHYCDISTNGPKKVCCPNQFIGPPKP